MLVSLNDVNRQTRFVLGSILFLTLNFLFFSLSNDDSFFTHIVQSVSVIPSSQPSESMSVTKIQPFKTLLFSLRMLAFAVKI